MPFVAFFLSTFFSESYLERSIAAEGSGEKGMEQKIKEATEKFIKTEWSNVQKALSNKDLVALGKFFAFEKWKEEYGLNDGNLKQIFGSTILQDVSQYKYNGIVGGKITANYVIVKISLTKPGETEPTIVTVTFERIKDGIGKAVDIEANGVSVKTLLKAQSETQQAAAKKK